MNISDYLCQKARISNLTTVFCVPNGTSSEHNWNQLDCSITVYQHHLLLFGTTSQLEIWQSFRFIQPPVRVLYQMHVSESGFGKKTKSWSLASSMNWLDWCFNRDRSACLTGPGLYKSNHWWRWWQWKRLEPSPLTGCRCKCSIPAETQP